MLILFLFLSIFLFIYLYRSITTKRPNLSHMPSSPPTNPQVKYDVFLSFRGDDTRNGFTSHLYAALKRKQILTFIDNELVRGDEISSSLLTTIEGSKLSVIVFSESYASSKWCLEELAKIFECRKNNGQIVVPIFYKIDPSDVRNQTGSFGDAFARLVKKKALAMGKVQSFRESLKDAANLSGWTLGKFELESEFVEKIVIDVLNKLHTMSSSHTMGLFGIDFRVNKIKSLLSMESQDVLIVGIWGMGGIGKTTIAEAVCNNIRSQFEGIFFENFRQVLKTCSMADLQRSFLSRLLGQEILNMSPLSFRDSFMRDRLRRKRVLIIIDDVDDSVPLEEWQELLLGRHDSFGPGSKVLITSRDKQVLTNVADKIYEVERLNCEEALQLFSSKALKNCNPTVDHRDLIKRITNYAQGNPLALIVLGSTLYGKSLEGWYSALNKLVQNPRIENALRISYDGLDQEQKSIFLDIAHFFRRWEQNHATRILNGFYDRSVIFDISMLIDKCLITISQNMLEMHDLLQEMAFSIVRAESKNPGKRSRLCDLDDVVHVLKNKKGSDRIEGISWDMSKLSRETHLESDAFAKMDRLKFLEFKHKTNKVHLPSSGIEYLSDELRYFRWDGFPSKTLPQNFNAENLVELYFYESKVEKLWEGVQDVVNLRKIELHHCECLTELPDISMANNLEFLCLLECESLTEVPSSLQCLEKLEEVYIGACYNLTSLPSRLDSKLLKRLSITWCPAMTNCPEIISKNMNSLIINETLIKEVPQSITSTLGYLDLKDCSNITKFPEVSGDIRGLYLNGTAIQEVPSSIQFLTRLNTLDMSGCSKLESFPESMEHMTALTHLYLSETGIKELPSSIQFLTRLKTLDMKGCSKLESFPEISEPMISLHSLELSKAGIKELPSSIKYLLSLKTLNIDGTPIRELPELPPSLVSLNARDCGSLESISIINLSNFHHQLNFSNCFKLDEKAVTTDMQLVIQSGQALYDGNKTDGGIEMVLPGSEIPEWFVDKGMGSSVAMQLPTNCHQLVGFAFCLVFITPPNNLEDRMIYNFIVIGKNNEDDEVIFKKRTNLHLIYLREPLDSDHLFLQYENIYLNNFSKYSGKKVTFEFYPMPVADEFDVRSKHLSENQKLCKVKRCGVYLHFDEDLSDQECSLYSKVKKIMLYASQLISTGDSNFG